MSSTEFIKMTTVMRKEVSFPKSFKSNLFFMFQWPEQNALIESANWEIPGYARGVKHVLVHNGKVMFAQTKIDDSSPKESSSTDKSKNEKAMDQYGEAWRIGDMAHCLSVLVWHKILYNRLQSFPGPKLHLQRGSPGPGSKK